MKTSTQKKFERLADQILDFVFTWMPVQATELGARAYDHSLGDYSPSYTGEFRNRAYDFLSRLEKLKPSDLGREEKIDRVLLINSLKNLLLNIEEIKFLEKDPHFYVDNALYGVFLLLVREFLSSKVQVKTVAQRLSHVPGLLEQAKENISNPSKVHVEAALEVAEDGASFFSEIGEKLGQDASEDSELRSVATKASRAVKSFQSWLETEVLPQAKGNFAIGKSCFNTKLKFNHLLPYSAEEILQIGEKVFAATHRKLEDLAKEIDPTKTWFEIYAEMKEQHPPASELVSFYRKQIEKAKKFTIEKNIADIPQNETLEIAETPLFLRSIFPWAMYIPPGPFEESRKGLFHITPISPSSPEKLLWEHNKFDILLYCLHETYPGHHLQSCYLAQNASPAQKYWAYANNIAVAEGWALYCESLARELGDPSDKQLQLATLRNELWRAARVILDVKLHCVQVSFQQAVDFLRKEVHCSRNVALAEVQCYALEPTWIMSYMIGKAEIQKIRAEYKKTMSKRFNLKDFHQRLLRLSGLPFPLLREELVPSR